MTVGEFMCSDCGNNLAFCVCEIVESVADRTDEAPPAASPTPMPKVWTDADVAEAFGHRVQDRFLHCGQLGGWMEWDGQRWRRDATKAVYDAAVGYVNDAARILLASDHDEDRARLAQAVRYRSRTRLTSVVEVASWRREIAARADDFDRHPDLLACRNGVVDLRSGELREHDPALLITQTTNTRYRPGATHADVDTVLAALPDCVHGWTRRLFGYAATGHVNEDVLPVLDGFGSNGKTTLLGAVRAALGDYACVADARLLMRQAHDEHPALLANLRGRRLVTVEETAEGGSLQVERMKFLTGGSVISARHMRQAWFEFDPTHLLCLATNHRPAVNSTEHATWRRLRLVPFPFRYTADGPTADHPDDRLRDDRLRHRLTLTRQREATLAWIIAGAVEWHRRGLGDCPAITDATDAWRRSEDVISRFITDRLAFDTTGDVGSQHLYDEYRRWCDSDGRPASSLKEFRKRFEDHDDVRDHHVEFRAGTMTGNRWFGVRNRAE